MRRGGRQSHAVDLLFTMSLFGIFAVCALLLSVIGIQVYRSTAAQLEETYSSRTVFSYVAEKVRSHDREGRVCLTAVGEETALLLTDEIEGTVYVTYLYPYEDHLWELMVREGTAVSPELGQQILSAEGFSISETDEGFLQLTARRGDGNLDTVYLHLRSSGGLERKD